MSKIRAKYLKKCRKRQRLWSWHHSPIFFVFLLVICSKKSSSSNVQLNQSGNTQNMHIRDPAHSVSTAMSDVICEFYISNGINFDFIVYGESSNHMNDVIDGVTKQISRDKPVTLKHITEIEHWKHKIKQSAVIFVKSEVNLQMLHHKTKFQNTKIEVIKNAVPESLKFLVYIDELKSFQKLHDFVTAESDPLIMMPAEMRFYEFFMTDDDKFINLTANLLYSEEKCGSFVPKLLNQYEKKSSRWVKKLENFNHFDNFHGCLLQFVSEFHSSLYIEDRVDIAGMATIGNNHKLKKMFIDGNLKFGGAINEIAEYMALKNNFAFHYTLIPSNEDGDSATFGLRNYKVLLLKGIVLNKEVIIRSARNMHNSEPFANLEYYYLVSENDLYTNYEKLLFPFDVPTWILLLITHSLTFGCIFGLHLCPRWIRQIIFGRGEQIMNKTTF
jgi:hypothetical protein